MKLGIDIDGTINDNYDLMRELADEYDQNLRGTGRINSNPRYVVDAYDWSRKETSDFLTNVYHPVIFNRPPRDNIAQIFQKLKELGHELIIITARSEIGFIDPYQETIDWFTKYGIPFDKIIVNSKNKLLACKEQEIDLFIDDDIYNCIEVDKEFIPVIYFSETEHDKFKNCHDWEDIYQYIKSLELDLVNET